MGSCLALRNLLSEETHVLTKHEILLGRDTQVESSRVREPRRTALTCGSQSPVFMVMGLVLGLSLINHFDSRSLVAHAWLSQDGFQREEFWKVVRTYGMVSPLSF